MYLSLKQKSAMTYVNTTNNNDFRTSEPKSKNSKQNSNTDKLVVEAVHKN